MAHLFCLVLSSSHSFLLFTSLQHKQFYSFALAFLSQTPITLLLLSTQAFRASFNHFESCFNLLGRFSRKTFVNVNMSVVPYYRSGKGASKMPRKFMLLALVLAATSAVLVNGQETPDENDIASQMEGATPAGVDDALVDSDQAAESLAAEFASTTPAWFSSLPASVTNYYNEISTPATMNVAANTKPTGSAAASVTSGVMDNEPWESLAAEASRLAADASSLSVRATSAGFSAYLLSQAAASPTNNASAAEAAEISRAATSLGRYAARESDLAVKISDAVEESNEASQMAHISRTLVGSLLVGAVMVFGGAILL
jgi:hypothetical protein